jgi:hypothetical protein
VSLELEASDDGDRCRAAAVSHTENAGRAANVGARVRILLPATDDPCTLYAEQVRVAGERCPARR